MPVDPETLILQTFYTAAFHICIKNLVQINEIETRVGGAFLHGTPLLPFYKHSIFIWKDKSSEIFPNGQKSLKILSILRYWESDSRGSILEPEVKNGPESLLAISIGLELNFFFVKISANHNISRTCWLKNISSSNSIIYRTSVRISCEPTLKINTAGFRRQMDEECFMLATTCCYDRRVLQLRLLHLPTGRW